MDQRREQWEQLKYEELKELRRCHIPHLAFKRLSMCDEVLEMLR